MPIQTKICGLRTRPALEAAVNGGAHMVGFVFFPPSPRALLPQQAADLVKCVPKGVRKVALSVDADDALLDQIIETVGVDMLQFHGLETPARVRTVRQRYGVPIIKAIAVENTEDLAQARLYEPVADMLMFDARPPKAAAHAMGAPRPGGNARAFDWHILQDQAWQKPWILAGGLNIENVARAVHISGAAWVDISSGVESRLGEKSVAKITEFLAHTAAL